MDEWMNGWMQETDECLTIIHSSNHSTIPS